MDKDKFNEWFQDNFDVNAVKYAESKEEEFEEYCLEKYSGEPDADYLYEMQRDREIEDNYLNR